MAVAFAEEREWETAESFISEMQPKANDRTTESQKRPERRVRRHSFQA